jgi:hypothetical protein
METDLKIPIKIYQRRGLFYTRLKCLGRLLKKSVVGSQIVAGITRNALTGN